jgi:hypothetical protein
MSEILRALSENRVLQSVNVSWNNVMEKSDVNPIRGGPKKDILPEEEVQEQIHDLLEKVQKSKAELTPEEL